MKIALCISGAPRQFKTCYPTLKKSILDHYECDIFISTWKSKIRHFKKPVQDEGSFNEVLDLYQPKSYARRTYNQQTRLELYNEVGGKEFQKRAQEIHNCKRGHKKDKCRFCGSNNFHNQLGQLYNIWRANQLSLEYSKQEKIIYDLAVRARFDNYYFDRLYAEQFKGSHGEVWVPYGYDDFPKYGSGVNDQFAIGSPDAMTTYSSMWPNLKSLIEQKYKEPEGYGVPHKTIIDVLNNNGVGLLRFFFRYVIYKKMGNFKKANGLKLNVDKYAEMRF